MRTPPCKGCVPPDRQIGCHGKCQRYAEYRELMEQDSKRRRIETDANEVTARAIARTKRQKHFSDRA